MAPASFVICSLLNDSKNEHFLKNPHRLKSIADVLVVVMKRNVLQKVGIKYIYILDLIQQAITIYENVVRCFA